MLDICTCTLIKNIFFLSFFQRRASPVHQGDSSGLNKVINVGAAASKFHPSRDVASFSECHRSVPNCFWERKWQIDTLQGRMLHAASSLFPLCPAPLGEKMPSGHMTEWTGLSWSSQLELLRCRTSRGHPMLYVVCVYFNENVQYFYADTGICRATLLCVAEPDLCRLWGVCGAQKA